MNNKKLFLIDGHSLIFRMYFAFLRQPMINSKGEDTSILFGVTKYILEIIKREKPSHVIVAFDPPCKTFRHEIYPEYKGNRSATPELVKSSLEPLIELVESLGIPVVMVNGYEADDVIGTLAKKGEENGFQVYMVTPDKDLGQLITDNIFQFKANNTRGHNELLGKAEICEKYGIEKPSQIVDVLTIWGDTSDNIKGVRGIGEVGAKKLVGEYGSVQNILKHKDELSASHRKAFEEAEPYLDLMKELITIKTDINININLSGTDLEFEFSDFIKTKELFRRYEFHSLIQHLPEKKGKISPIFEDIFPTAKTANYTIVEYNEIFDLASKHLAIAIKMERDLLYLSMGEKVFTTTDYHIASDILENPEIKKIGYDIKGCLNKLRRHSISLKGYFADLEILHYLLNPERSHKIDILTEKYLGLDIATTYYTVSKRGPVRGGDLFSSYDLDTRQEKEECISLKESSVLTRLYENILNDLKEDESLLELYESIEMPLLKVLADMEYEGFKIDTDMLTAYSEKLTIEAVKLETKIKKEADEPNLNIASFKQLGIVIYEKLKLNPKIKKNARNSYPTDEETLSAIRDKHPMINDLLEYRGITKLTSTYIDPFPNLINPETGKIHTTFNQSMTATGRLSSAKPNLQNIPIRTKLGKYIREAFIPSHADGYIVSADYSQIELRVMAVLSEDTALIDAFNHGRDIHTSTASRIFSVPEKEVTPEQRRTAKVANFGIMYGISPFGLSKKLKITPYEAKDIMTEYFKSYPELYNFIEQTKETVRKIGYIETICKRKRHFPNINSDTLVTRNLSERNAINAPIQGSAADIIKIAMINVGKRFAKEGIKSKMILQVHDELVFDVIHEEKEIVMKIAKEEMENVFSLSIPLTVDCNFGSNWLEAH